MVVGFEKQPQSHLPYSLDSDTNPTWKGGNEKHDDNLQWHQVGITNGNVCRTHHQLVQANNCQNPLQKQRRTWLPGCFRRFLEF